MTCMSLMTTQNIQGSFVAVTFGICFFMAVLFVGVMFTMWYLNMFPTTVLRQEYISSFANKGGDSTGGDLIEGEDGDDDRHHYYEELL